MKELKAVEILTNIREMRIAVGQLFGQQDVKELDEALSELSEFTQEKSCEGCKHYRTSIDDFPYCEKYERRNLEDEDFYCDRLGFKDHYTPKG